MIVYGERSRTISPRQALRELTATLREAEAESDGRARHDRLTSAFLQASELAQGIADAELAARGADDGSPAQEAALALLIALARKLAASAWSGFITGGPPVSAELMALALATLPDEVEVKTPEGYAHYAVYPEAFLKAAAERPWDAPPFVIGLRSIGTGLSALVAAVTGAQEVATLRPTGHPFRRELRIGNGLKARLAAHDGPFAVVDEGPGLSGSSFGAAVDLLTGVGVAAERIVLLPSHAGEPGPEAAPEIRARWAGLAKRPATFESLIEDEPLAGWFEDLTGPISRIEDLSGGAWAAERADDPPTFGAFERRKYRLTTASGVWLAKYAGLGPLGEAKLARARTLARAGAAPEPLALRRGFLIGPWLEGAPGVAVEREAFVDHLGRYLALRVLAFPAAAEDGASLAALDEMMRANAAELLGAEAAAALPGPPPGAERRPIHVDGRLHAWEWITTPDRGVLKTDALDHSAGHDLVGCQDVAWDVAGAKAEFDLDALETARLCAAIEAVSGQAVDAELLGFFEVAYPAFQAGLWRLASDERQVSRYAERLR